MSSWTHVGVKLGTVVLVVIRAVHRSVSHGDDPRTCCSVFWFVGLLKKWKQKWSRIHIYKKKYCHSVTSFNFSLEKQLFVWKIEGGREQTPPDLSSATRTVWRGAPGRTPGKSKPQWRWKRCELSPGSSWGQHQWPDTQRERIRSDPMFSSRL